VFFFFAGGLYFFTEAQGVVGGEQFAPCRLRIAN